MFSFNNLVGKHFGVGLTMALCWWHYSSLLVTNASGPKFLKTQRPTCHSTRLCWSVPKLDKHWRLASPKKHFFVRQCQKTHVCCWTKSKRVVVAWPGYSLGGQERGECRGRQLHMGGCGSSCFWSMVLKKHREERPHGRVPSDHRGFQTCGPARRTVNNGVWGKVLANGGQCTCGRGPNKCDQGGPDRYQWPKGNTYWCGIGWCEGRLACWFSVFGFCCWSRITIRQEGQQAQGVWGGWRHQLLWLGQSGVGWIQGTQGHVAPGSPFKPDRGKQCASICGQESLRHPHCEPQCLGGSVFGGHEDVWVAATICWRVLGHRPAATRSSTEWSSYYQWLSSGLWQHRQCDGLWPRVPDLHQCDLVKAPCQSNSSRLYSWSLQK